MDVRVIAASSKPLDDAVARGEFRSDLYHRLSAVRIHLPPLRERVEDIPALLTHFAGQAAHRLGHPVSVTPSALAALTQYGWPGNVRELRSAVDRAAAMAGDGPLDVKDFAGLARNGNGNGNGHGARQRVARARSGSEVAGRSGRASGDPARAGGLRRQSPAGGLAAGDQPAHAVLQDAAAAGTRLIHSSGGGGAVTSRKAGEHRARSIGVHPDRGARVVVVLGLITLIGFPRSARRWSRSDLRSARTTVINLVATARAASCRPTGAPGSSSRATTPSCWPGRGRQRGAGNADTVGTVQDPLRPVQRHRAPGRTRSSSIRAASARTWDTTSPSRSRATATPRP